MVRRSFIQIVMGCLGWKGYWIRLERKGIRMKQVIRISMQGIFTQCQGFWSFSIKRGKMWVFLMIDVRELLCLKMEIFSLWFRERVWEMIIKGLNKNLKIRESICFNIRLWFRRVRMKKGNYRWRWIISMKCFNRKFLGIKLRICWLGNNNLMNKIVKRIVEFKK